MPCGVHLGYHLFCDTKHGGVQYLFSHSRIFKRKSGVWEDQAICKAIFVVFTTMKEELVDAMIETTQKKKKINIISSLAHNHTILVFVGDGRLIIGTRDYIATPRAHQISKVIMVEVRFVKQDCRTRLLRQA